MNKYMAEEEIEKLMNVLIPKGITEKVLERLIDECTEEANSYGLLMHKKYRRKHIDEQVSNEEIGQEITT